MTIVQMKQRNKFNAYNSIQLQNLKGSVYEDIPVILLTHRKLRIALQNLLTQ